MPPGPWFFSGMKHCCKNVAKMWWKCSKNAVFLLHFCERKERLMNDWVKMKSEYVRDPSISYRILSEKYGVSLSSIQKRASKEKWADLRQQICNKYEAKIQQSAINAQLRRANKVEMAADLLLDMILNGIEDKTITLTTVKSIREITGALKDLKDIRGVKNEFDLREQIARIDKLQKEAAEDRDTPDEIKIVIAGELDKYKQ